MCNFIIFIRLWNLFFLLFFILICTFQKQAWPDHKRECKCLKRLQPRIPTDSVRLLTRIIFKLVCDIRTPAESGPLRTRSKSASPLKLPQGLMLLHPFCFQLGQSESDQEDLYSIAEHQSRKSVFYCIAVHWHKARDLLDCVFFMTVCCSHQLASRSGFVYKTIYSVVWKCLRESGILIIQPENK